MLTWSRSEQSQEKARSEEREDTRKEGICVPVTNYLFMILGVTADKYNCRESPTELLLTCDRAAPPGASYNLQDS